MQNSSVKSHIIPRTGDLSQLADGLLGMHKALSLTPQELRGLLAHARNSSTHEAGGRGIRSPKAFEARL